MADGLEVADGPNVADGLFDGTIALPRAVVLRDALEHNIATMAAYCAAVGIPFRRPALHWAPGDRDEWRPSARWHVRVSESTGFTPSPTSYETTTANNAMLARYSAHHEPFYRALRAHKLAIPTRDL